MCISSRSTATSLGASIPISTLFPCISQTVTLTSSAILSASPIFLVSMSIIHPCVVLVVHKINLRHSKLQRTLFDDSHETSLFCGTRNLALFHPVRQCDGLLNLCAGNCPCAIAFSVKYHSYRLSEVV